MSYARRAFREGTYSLEALSHVRLQTCDECSLIFSCWLSAGWTAVRGVNSFLQYLSLRWLSTLA
jgi:hypothetical protein